MDLEKTIHQLKIEKEKLEHAIVLLEDLQSRGGNNLTYIMPKRRGRTSMPSEERREVSKRMKNYWASRRQAKAE